MTTENVERQERGLSRRTLAKGAAWSVPVIAAAASAPAYAVSPTCKGLCYKAEFTSADQGKLASEVVLTGTPVMPGCNQPPITVSMTLNMGGTAGGASSKTVGPATNKYSSAFNGKIGYQGEQNDYAASSPYKIGGLSPTDPGLVLNIGYNTTTTVTFNFSEPVSSASLEIFDITRSNNTNTNYRYTDTVTINQPWTMSGDMSYANRTSGAAGETFSRTTKYNTTPIVRNVMTTRATSPFSSLTFTYSAPVSYGWQFIAIDELTFCRP
ncbi:hypothetical protein RF638_15300 [Kocuria sp. CPCC 205235]|uniref:hypothetical protein n=1 Tax=Kocuria sp. CPCC 205235 TaxID=3073549 RepID=UPI0034D6F65F